MAGWTVSETEAFKKDLEDLRPEGGDWSAAMKGVRWLLARKPLELGYSTADSEVRIFLQDHPPPLPGLKFFYVVSGSAVTLIRARAFKIDEDD
jgi:hypothetical protein